MSLCVEKLWRPARTVMVHFNTLSVVSSWYFPSLKSLISYSYFDLWDVSVKTCKFFNNWCVFCFVFSSVSQWNRREMLTWKTSVTSHEFCGFCMSLWKEGDFLLKIAKNLKRWLFCNQLHVGKTEFSILRIFCSVQDGSKGFVLSPLWSRARSQTCPSSQCGRWPPG